MMSRTRRSAWTFGSGLVTSAVNFGATLAAAPWLLRWLGDDRFGAYRMLWDLLGYVVLLELGLGVTVMAGLARALAQGDPDSVRDLLAAGLRAYTRVAWGMVLVGLSIAYFLPALVETSLPERELRLGWLLLLPVALLVPFSVFRWLLDARQQGYRVNLLLTAQAIVTTGLLLLTASAGWGLPGQGLAAAVASAVTAAALVGYGVRAYPGVIRHRPSAAATESVWKLNWPTFVASASIRVGLLSDSIVVGWALGAASVTPYYLTQRLVLIALTQLTALGSASWAGLAELFGRGELELFRLRLRDLTVLVSGAGAVVLGPLVAYNQHFVRLWVGADAYAGDAVTLLVGVNTWLWSVTGIWGWTLFGTGEIRRWVPYAMVFMVINVLVSVVGTLTLGLVGPLLGSTVGFLAIHVWALPRVMAGLFGVSPGALWRSAATPLLWALPYAATLWWIAASHTPTGWIGLLAEIGASGGVGLLLWWRLSLDRDQRHLWIERVRGVIGNRAGGVGPGPGGTT